MKKVLTTCLYCGVGCQLYLKVVNGKVVGVVPERIHGVNQGKLCIKGWKAHEFIHHPDRLKKPLIRKDGKFVETGWNDALTHVSRKLQEIKRKYGSDSIGLLASSKCTNEEDYLMQKLARAVIGTNNIDNCARLCHASTIAGLVTTFGSGAMTNSIAEIENADVIFIIGSNTTEQHPLIARRILRAVRKGSRLILADPRSIDLAGFATIQMQQKPGTDVALLNGMMNVILRKGLEDKDFIQSRTENFEALKQVVEKYTPEYVEKITGVPASRTVEAARLYAQGESSTIIYSMGITQHTTGVDNVISVANLAMLTGNIGKESTGVNPLRGHNNVQGACDVGCLPIYLPGYQKVDDASVRTKFESAWGVKLPEKAGLTMVEMINACGKEIKALYIMGENPMLSDPDINHVRESLKKLEFYVAQDMFVTETSELADVILPSASFAERDGTYTNTERRVQRIREAVEPIGECRPDWEILCQVASKLGYDMHYDSPKEIMDEIASLTPIYGGIAYDRLDFEGLQWPCPNKEHPGTKYLHKEKFSRGLGKFIPIEYKPPAEETDEEYPMILTTGRVLFHFHTGTLTRRSPSLNELLSEGYVEVNPIDAKKLGISEGDKVKVESRRGEIAIKARVSEIVPKGIVFIPFHFREAAANALTNAALDPVAKIPEYKVCAVRLERV